MHCKVQTIEAAQRCDTRRPTCAKHVFFYSYDTGLWLVCLHLPKRTQNTWQVGSLKLQVIVPLRQCCVLPTVYDASNALLIVIGIERNLVTAMLVEVLLAIADPIFLIRNLLAPLQPPLSFCQEAPTFDRVRGWITPCKGQLASFSQSLGFRSTDRQDGRCRCWCCGRCC